jgi:hypothetical protein
MESDWIWGGSVKCSNGCPPPYEHQGPLLHLHSHPQHQCCPEKDKYEGLVREILIGLHHYITIIFDRSVEGEICQVTLNYILGKFNTKRDDAHLLE